MDDGDVDDDDEGVSCWQRYVFFFLCFDAE